MSQSENSHPIRVLSLDGGGMRGLYTVTLLSNLAKVLRPGEEIDIGSAFDLIVGTSTGGILATALAKGVPIAEVSHLYRHVGPKIFTDPQPQPNLKLRVRKGCLTNILLAPLWVVNIFRIWFDPFVRWCRRNATTAANDPAPLRAELTRLFEGMTFAELYQKRKIGLCLTAVKILDEKLRVFKTPHVPSKNWDVNLPLVDACMATSAAPLFLPLAAVKNPMQEGLNDIYADGGLAVNNPVLIGLIEALQIAGASKREIQIFSVGTCSAPEGSVVSAHDINRGLAQWKVGAKALGLSMNAQASAADFSARFLANWFNTHSDTKIHVIRFPEANRSEANLQFLKMDNASEQCCQAFMAFGNDDAMAAKSKCDRADDKEGLMIKAAFANMQTSK